MLAAAMDIGGTKTIIALVDNKGSIINKRQIKTNTYDYKAHFDCCIKLMEECLSEHFLNKQDILGLGINLPGMVNSTSGLLYHAPFAGWRNVKVIDYFSKQTGLKNIYIENDVNSCAEGEMFFGNTSGNFLWITVSTGIGGAVVVNNKLIFGENNCAGEIGHVKVEYENPRKCSCGQFGCTEAQASGTAINTLFKELIHKDSSYIDKLKQFDLNPDASGCAFLARLKDEECIKIFKTCGLYLGRALSTAANLLNPKEIFIGGGVSLSFDLIIDEIQKQIKENTIPQCSVVTVKPTALGYEAALLAAASLVFRRNK
jgi:glucokinase